MFGILNLKSQGNGVRPCNETFRAPKRLYTLYSSFIPKSPFKLGLQMVETFFMSLESTVTAEKIVHCESVVPKTCFTMTGFV